LSSPTHVLTSAQTLLPCCCSYPCPCYCCLLSLACLATATEQTNLINDTAQVDRIAAMRHTLSLEVGEFFSNRDKFVNDCPVRDV
jgi:hypothetical protein